MTEPTTAELGDVPSGDTIYKVHATLLADPPRGDSSQPANDAEQEFGTPDDCITPPLSLDGLCRLTETSGVRSSCLDAVARNTVGLGYTIKALPGHDPANPDDHQEQLRELRARLEACSRRDRRLNAPTLTELLYVVKHDEEECGQGALEVSRDKRTSQIDGFYHVPGRRLRRLSNRRGWALLPPDGDVSRATRFNDFGDTSGGRNEIIVWQLYTSSSRDYGLPRDSSMMLEYLADKAAAMNNAGFFDASGTPPTILFVQGEERKDGNTVHVQVPRETAQRVASTLKPDSSNRQNRVAIIPIPPGVKAQKEELGRVSERDMGFVAFRHDNRRRTLGAFRMSPIFIADLEDAGRYTAEVERSVTLEQVFDPEQTRYEERLHDTVVTDLGFADLRIDFTRLAVEGDTVKRESAVSMGEAGCITRREFRAAHGQGPLPESDKDDPVEAAKEGKVVKGWNDQLVDTGQPAGAQNRTLDAASQQGLRPGIAGRSPSDRQHSADQAVGALASTTGGAGRRGAGRAVARARALVP